MKKQTKIRIRKAVSFIRTLFLCLALLGIGFAICLADDLSLIFPLGCVGISLVCFAISFALDHLLFETAYNTKSIFYH